MRLAAPHQFHEICKARLVDAEFGLCAAEMVEHDRHRGGRGWILDRRDHREIGEQLDMPAPRLDAVDRGLKARTAHGGIVDATGCEIEPDAAAARPGARSALPRRWVFSVYA